MRLAVVVLVIAGLCVNTAPALPGSGTQEDPYRIESLADFDDFASDPNYWSGFTRLETDVNLAGRTYSTAVIAPDVNNSNYEFDGTAFTGIFDGNDHKITNLTIDDGGAGNDYLGLFGYIEEDGQVRNLGLESGSISGQHYVGGLVALNYGIVSNCYSTDDVIGYGAVGGLVGGNGNFYDPGGSISNCYSTGDVGGRGSVGGLVGDNYADSILNCYSTSDVSGRGSVGGLLGGNSASVSNCYSTGSVSGEEAVGGLVGYNEGGDIERSFWDVQTSGIDYSAAGTGKTTAEMQTRSTFTESGWDFVDIWLINEGATYPVLRQEIRSDLNGNGGVDMLDFAVFADHWLEGTGD